MSSVPLSTSLDVSDQAIKVAVRLRNVATLKKHDPSIELCINRVSPNTLTIQDPNNPKCPKTFNFDAVFAMEDDQSTLYNQIVEPLISRCLEGYNGCVFAYGQTAAGKSYTMQGPAGALSTPIGSSEHGIILRVAEQISNFVKTKKKNDGMTTQFMVKASYLEIYNEKLSDLLGAKDLIQDLKIRMDPESISGKGLYVQGLTEVQIVEADDYVKVIKMGTKNRTVGETNMNEVSSRSHAVLTLTIDQVIVKESPGTLSASSSVLDFNDTSTQDCNQTIGRKRSKIHLIDLAGSERADSTGAVGQRLKEGSAINQSLSCLGNVINALTTQGQRHVPYRDSKLTYLLSDSLGGNSLTLMITCCTPTPKNYLESLSTLRFAERAKKVQNRAKINMDTNALRILQLEEEVKSLKLMLEQAKRGVVKMDSFTQAAMNRVDVDTQTDNLRDMIPIKKKKRFWFGMCGAQADAVVDTY
ncbi:P-loop containing nucleoside triphosphate hydrolase protein [Chytridium lagenaria]|nr:P-loop containing nucleoside triphosphate hydrolase protein [Chytridium lagenaria]